ncbi:hypothetical protein [Parvularcula lutaonensis]|uniref:Uncharacterized protein n=1 Tax=Parvularcula lutaonensis TaxID=491923 RepID=A0ABV7MC92_9PROT|nr:hypothetical protein [Parvularcula lutaonensis]GGY49791.1 hypothetical protein GCM10007148_18040 [Parvularcula lutaonensis]
MARRPQQSEYIGGEEVREESGWRYPLLIFVATLILSGFVLFFYFGPSPEEIAGDVPRPSVAEDSVILTVGGIPFDVPANHTVFPRDRRAGARESLALYAAWPRMDGYTPSRRTDFIENRANSRRIDVLIEENNTPFDEKQRLEILYKQHVTEAGGVPFEHGLTKYEFGKASSLAPGAGYEDRVMYVGTTEDGEEAVLFCYDHEDEELVPPDCFRIYDISEEVWVRYIFKEVYLPEWRKIDTAVKAFVNDLRADGAS